MPLVMARLTALSSVPETTVFGTAQVGDVIAFGYIRVSTAEQAAGGLGLDAQRAAVEAACRQRRWELRAVYEDAGLSAKTNYRPGLDKATAACAMAEDAVLVVAKLDRLARSLTGYASLIERAQREGWRLLALDTPETDTPHGEAMQGITAVFAQLERRLIGQRTKEALAAARSRGVRLGRPPAIGPEVIEAVRCLLETPMTVRQIGRHLEQSGFPAPHGGSRWHPSTVARAVALVRARRMPPGPRNEETS